jgi:hypothetical protein
MKKGFWSTVGVPVLLLAGGLIWFFLTLGEIGKPVVEIGADAAAIGLRKDLTVVFSDSGRGLRHTEVIITQDNLPRVVHTADYTEAGLQRKATTVAVDTVALKLHDGPAVLTLTAVDRSLWNNRKTMKIQAVVDTLPPQIFQLNPQNHINPGGACVVAYHLSEAAPLTGVRVGDFFFPAYSTTLRFPGRRFPGIRNFSSSPETGQETKL